MGRENCLCKLSIATMRNLWTSSPHWRPIFLVFYFLFTLVSTQTDPRAAEYEAFTVYEGLPAQTVIGTIATRTGFTYSLSEESPYFDIDGDSGTLRTRIVIDRDILSSDVFNLVVLSSAPTYPIEVRITVLDINDNAPVFPQPVLDIPFSESASIGTQVILDTAVDSDEKQNDVTADYAVVSSNAVGVFSLIITTNPDGDMTFLHLELIGTLDRETQDSYQLNISAQDGGDPIKYGFMLLNITVTDANDNEPIFETSAYDISLNESVLVGTTVIQVRATDADIGSNAAITYSLKDSSDSFDTQYFTIDPQTGVISVLEEVSYDVSPSYTLTVEAWDNGHPRLVGRAYVSIRLIDQNNHAPTVNFSDPAKENSITIEEGVPIERTITIATVSDKDTGLNGYPTLKIFSGNDLDHFRLEVYTLTQSLSLFLLKINGVIDRERHPRYNITFQASDIGSPRRSSFVNLIINVSDQNDHPPEFQKPFYAANLSELVPIGSFVQSVTATDEDSGANADIMYEIIDGNELDWFEIDENSGLVLTKKTIDRETTSTVTLNISASDQGIVVFSTSALLNITILDENDEVPSFTEAIYNASVPENSMSGYQLVTVSASDNDEGDKGVVTYSFSQETIRRFPGVFNIDPNFGIISTTTSLDRETINRYVLEVIAQDSGSPSLTSIAIVNIEVEDENDNNPVFYPENYFADILENKPSGTFVVQVIASDADSGESERIQYSIIQDDSQGKFEIDSETGWVTSTEALDREIRSSYTLTVTAMDEGSREAVTPAIVQISVVDERDSPPIFSQNDYQFVIFENVPVASSIGTVHATTPDLNTDITYTIFSGDPNGVFQINEVSGQINVVGDVDRESQPFYQLTVFANGGSMIGRTIVNITILDLNDNSPMFPRLTDSANVVENWEIGHVVYQAQAVDADSGPNAKIAYELVRNPDMTFAIDPNSGIVTLRKTLQNSEYTEFFIQILAIDFGTPQQSSILNVSISIRDVNNHAPVFLSSHFGHSISEAIPVNTRFISVSATDDDEGENGKITYVISDGNVDDKFGIFPDGNVYVKSYLDREQTERYTLTIYAFDGGVPQKSSETTLTVQILDENDNRPLFENNTYVFYLDENLPPGFVLGQVRSKDRDIGPNAEITYSFVNNQTEFALDPVTGLITSKVMFDREIFYQKTGSNQIIFDIIATDSGELPLQDQTSVIVNIVDINDNAPEFSRQIYEVSISELAPNSTSVVRVSAIDADYEDNSYLTYTIVSGNEQQRFSINHVSGQIILSGSLDREVTNDYSLVVAAHDAASPPKSATATVEISVLDGNDNIPVFASSILEIDVVESFPVGKELTSVTATDVDLNGVISYQITNGNIQNVFAIEPNTGSLFLTKSLDFETRSIYKLNITASDGGTSPNMNTITLIINVRDYNDNPPVFPSNSVVFSVSENTDINTELLAVTAMDPDSGINGELQYSIVGQIPEGRNFAIQPSSGILYTAGEIDREDLLDYNGLFHVTVQATDQAQPVSNRKMATKNVTIIVTDKNDNDPVFVSQNAAVISETASIGATVTTVIAIDKDEGINGKVTYELNANGFFDVNPQSGVITLIDNIDLSTPKYSLLVTAKDNGTEQRQTYSSLTVIIGDNENSGPSFTSNSYSASIAENAVDDTAVLTVSAMYADARSANIQYFITAVSAGSSSRERDFVISNTNGIIRTSAPLDHENGNDVYTITVYAVDVDASTPHTKNTQVRITVTDINDNAPVFEKDSYRVTIPENASPGSLLTSVSATDIDSSGSISYRIINANPALFQIDSTSGELRTAATLDRETKQLYRFSVEASDGTLTSRASVEIEVNDFNDNDPIFSEQIYSFSVPEDEVVNSEVAIVSATDADDGSNAELEYSIVADGGFGEDVFQINSETGVISLTETLDYETRAYYALTVQASDKGSPSRSSTATVYFNVLDVNDHSPIFNPDHYEQWVLENTSIGTQILQVVAEDADSGNNAIFKYSITSGNSGNLFTINDDGIIYTNKVLDRESKAFYNLAVTATDQPSDPSTARSSTAQVSILLSDINDNAPQFTNPGVISVPEHTSIGTIIMVIHATDPDATENSYVSYSMSPVPGDVFRLDADGNLQVWGQLDRETRAEYTLTVIASDKGQPVQSSSMNIAVEITDSNDNPPVFLVDSPHVTLSESLPVGVEFLRVSATDADEGENSELIFKIISGNTNNDFAIDSSRGVLFSQNPLDRERTSSYTITVQAEDSSRSPLYATTNVNIDISDVNDYKPVFLDSPYTINVQENAQSLPVIINSVSATDLDANSNGQLTYTLVDNIGASLFTIDPSTGYISIHQALDREVTEQYTLTITARDAGSPSLTGTGTIKIIVGDENDNIPVFDPDAFSIAIDEEVPIGKDVLLVSATDADAGDNGNIRYQLNDEIGTMFTINPVSGQIITAGRLDREVLSTYNLVVTAMDGNALNPANSRTATANVVVHLNDINDNGPVFPIVSLTATIPSTCSAGTYVRAIGGTDADEPSNSDIIYSITTGDTSKFQVDTSSGVITTKNQLTSESSSYVLEVTGSDPESAFPVAVATVTITFSSSQFPIFSAVQTSYHIQESLTVGSLLVTLHAVSLNAGTTYALSGGNIDGAFSIDRNGQITIAKNLDREVTSDYQLWVEARSESSPALSSFLMLDITITDVNDNAPVFTQILYNGVVMENNQAPVSVVVVTANDADLAGNGQFDYEIDSAGNHQSAFSINRETGEISTTKSLDREEYASYTLTVYAKDEGSPSMTGTSLVEVTVQDQNDNGIRFDSIYSATLPENSAFGSYVITVTATDNDGSTNTAITYSINDDDRNVFDIDPTSGRITVVGNLNYESQSIYRLAVEARDTSHLISTSVTINIVDVNDNAPVFTEVTYEKWIQEGLPVNTPVFEVTAVDVDEGDGGEVRYRMKTMSDYFKIDSVTGVISIKNEILFITQDSTINDPNLYTVSIVAYDRGVPSFSNDTVILFHVQDSNDHPPVFEEESYFSPAPENIRIEQPIIQVIAKDELDIGINAEIIYSISGGNGSATFEVNPASGWISPKASLEGFIGRYFQLLVKAQDQGQQDQMEATTTVIILVTSINVNRPTFTGTPYQVMIPEDQLVPSQIFIASASDEDAGMNGEILYSITSGNQLGLFNINPSTGAVSVIKPLDYESKNVHYLYITATDQAWDSKESTVVFTVQLTDINDNSPVFNPTSYTAMIAENSPSATTVVTVSATDADTPPNAEFYYSIIGGSGSDYFIVNSETGIILTQGNLDYESSNQDFELTVAATDVDPQVFRQGIAHVMIHVTGVNEYFPRFIQHSYDFFVREDAVDGFVVDRVIATDTDQGADGEVFYYLVGANTDKGFSINEVTGEIFVSKAHGTLDRETENKVVLTVLAKNAGPIDGDNVDKATVTMFITDANDPPIFLEENYFGSVSEGAAVETSILTVTAVEYDELPNDRRFNYSITAGNINNAFKVDSSGAVKVNNNLDRETIDEYTLTVSATDAGSPPQSGFTTVIISLTDVNDNGPILETAVGSVLENKPIGTVVMTLMASDPDIAPQGPFSFSIYSGGSKFDLDRSSGLLTTNAVFDRESQSEYFLSIEISDSGSPQMTSISTLRIKIEDENDNPSSSRTARIEVKSYESIFPGGLIAEVKPNDVDTDDTFSCRLISSDITSMFSILPGCELHSTSYIGVNQYQLTVSGNDGIHAEVQSTFSVEFEQFGSAALPNSLTLRLSDTNAEYFVMNSYNQFLMSVSSLLNSGESIIVFSLKDVVDNNQLDLLVAIERSNGQYITRPQASAFFQSNINTIESQSNVDIDMINFTPCQLSPCQNQGTCSDYVEMYDDEIIVETSEIIIVARNTSRVFECACAIEFHGDLCELEVDQCESVACQNGGTCVDGSGSFSCQCLSGFSGDLCEINNDDCNGNLCTNGGTCIDLVNTYRCECPTGYFGVYCEEGPCTSQPCRNGGTCREQGGTYECECNFGEKGNNCQFSSIGFEGGSYMEFISTLRSSSNIITIEFTTVQANALLFYNHDGTTTFSSNFLALEIIEGQLQLSYSDGGDIIRIKTMKMVSDGQWHTVQAKQDNQGCDLVLFDADCPPSPDNAKMCRDSKTANLIRGLNLQGVPVSIGGVMSVKNVTDRSWQVSTADYVGCIRDIYVNGQQLGNSNLVRSAGTIDGCPRDLTTCSGQVCAGQSVCVDEWWTYRCECEEGKAGLTCNEVPSPVSFGSGAYVEYTVKESYRRQQQLDNEKSNNNRKRRATNKQSLNIRFRTQANDGLLLLVKTGEEFTLLQVVDGALTYSYGTSYSTVDTITIISPKCNTGSWHNASIVRDNRHITLSLDDVSKSSTFDKTPPDFSGVDVTLMSLGGTKDNLVVDGTAISGLEGCLDNFRLNGEELPFDGGNEAFEVTVSTNTAKGCSVVDLCSSNPCLTTELCTDQGTYYECSPLATCGTKLCGENEICVVDDSSKPMCQVAPKDSNSSLVIILVLVFIILAGIIAALLFIIIRKRKKEKKDNIPNPGAVFPSSEDNLDQQPGHYNMAFDDPSLVKGQPEVTLRQPDILENESNRYKYPNISPICHNTIMDTDDVTIGIEDSIDEQIVPEHYDIENASSIAPSDVEATYYYRNYHDIDKRHRKHNYGKRSPNPLLARMQRDSPVSHISRHSPNPLLRASPNMYADIPQKSSARQSPAGFKPNIRASPLHSSQPASPTKDLMQQRANSQYSLTSEQPSIYSAPVARTGSPAINELSLKSQSQTKLRSPNGIPNGMPVGLTVDEVKRLNTARPDLMMGSHASTMDNLSSLSSDDETGVKSSVLIDSTRLLEPPDSTSDESNDSFTCSEFESETEHTISRSELEPGTLIFSRLAEVENETDEVDQDATIPYNYEGFNSIGGSLSTLFMSEDELPHLKQNGLFNWDEFLNWGPAFEKLVGVFKDISQLQDSSDSESCVKISHSINNTIEEEYV